MYTALYRKLRPRRFADIVGQEHIVRTLKNQVKSGKTSHAYLFCGTRGTGKTSTALVFAKAVNCEKPEDGEACNVCPACVAISRGGGFNVIEIDAASNNGVDSIREIREEVKYPPTDGRFRVYIMDEAHMLTPQACNALLKTLEEPPQGVIFILATTDPGKIPVTVHSRCQRFDFRRVPLDAMVEAVGGYLENEGIACDADALRYGARIAEGSMRDVLSVLDRCAAFSDTQSITLDTIMNITGAVCGASLAAMMTAIVSGDIGECLLVVDSLVKNGKDVHQLAAEFTAHLRDTLIAVTAGDGAVRILEMPAENIKALKDGAAGMTLSTLTRCITTFSELTSGMRYAGNLRVLFEAACISLSRLASESGI